MTTTLANQARGVLEELPSSAHPLSLPLGLNSLEGTGFLVQFPGLPIPKIFCKMLRWSGG
jgi:hypothetical protein